MKKSVLYSFLFLILSSVLLFSRTTSVESAPATNVVISEVMLRSVADADDEFIELYNPTAASINLEGWKLTRKPQDGAPETNLIASLSGTIPSLGFFLVANDESFASGSADALYASSIAGNNTISLYNTTVVVDKVGIGGATDAEGSPAATPSAGQSVERKANSASTVASMTTGADELLGNAEDSDNNLADFIVRTTPQPQSSTSAIEPQVITPTPTDIPPTPTATPSPTLSPSPTLLPTPTATATPTPIQSGPTVTPTPDSRPRLSCSFTQKTIRIAFFTFRFPIFSCRFLR